MEVASGYYLEEKAKVVRKDHNEDNYRITMQGERTFVYEGKGREYSQAFLATVLGEELIVTYIPSATAPKVFSLRKINLAPRPNNCKKTLNIKEY